MTGNAHVVNAGLIGLAYAVEGEKGGTSVNGATGEWFIWSISFIWSIWFVWLSGSEIPLENQTDRRDQTDQMNPNRDG